MSNKDLLLEIQKEAIERSSALSTVLRKCVLFASRLGNKPLRDWAQWELSGYPESSGIPEYRIVNIVKGLLFYGDFVDAAGSLVIQNAPVSVLGLPEPFRDDYSNYRICAGVEEIAEETRSRTERWNRVAWPAEAYGAFKNKDYSDDLRLVHAWTHLPVSHFVGLLDTIRNRVLEFTIEIGTLDLKLENGVLSEESKKATGAQITQTFHQTITDQFPTSQLWNRFHKT
jgi:hypothetical protein